MVHSIKIEKLQLVFSARSRTTYPSASIIFTWLASIPVSSVTISVIFATSAIGEAALPGRYYHADALIADKATQSV